MAGVARGVFSPVFPFAYYYTISLRSFPPFLSPYFLSLVYLATITTVNLPEDSSSPPLLSDFFFPHRHHNHWILSFIIIMLRSSISECKCVSSFVSVICKNIVCSTVIVFHIFSFIFPTTCTNGN